jgi:hypothetical protein
MSADGKLRIPARGDISVCAECNGVSVFDGDNMRDPSPLELRAIQNSPRIQKALSQRAEVVRMIERLKKKAP